MKTVHARRSRGRPSNTDRAVAQTQRLTALLKFDSVSVLDQRDKLSADELRDLRNARFIEPAPQHIPGQLGRPKNFYNYTPLGVTTLAMIRSSKNV